MRTTKKILSMILAFVLVLGLLPATAFATEVEDVVYLSISFDTSYIDDKNGNPIAYVPVPLSKIEAIDLAEYGLDNMLFDADGDGAYETTALQLLIYAHEEIYGGEWSDVNFDALPGSSYFRGGIFGFTENLVYFQNGDFPVDETLQSDYMTVGATSDRIVLEAGDFLDVASFGCFSFLWDQAGGFHLFADENDNYTHDYTANAGEALSVKLKHSFCDLMYGESWVKDAADYEVYYGSIFGEAECSVTTDESGCAEITFPNAGTYYVWCEGGIGTDDGFTHTTCDHYMETGEPCVVSAPAYSVVHVISTGCREHIVETDPAVAATCTTPGLTAGTHCVNCGEVITAQEEIPATGHCYGSWSVVQDPTFTAEGKREKTCTSCGDVIRETIPVAVGKVEQWNITLTDALQVNFLLSVSETVSSTATVNIVAGGTEITRNIAELPTTENGLYVASVKLSAAQMTEDITVSILNNGDTGDSNTYTIRQYADTLLADETQSKYHTLVKEMLNYGAAAQVYFGYRKDSLANNEIAGAGLKDIPENADRTFSVSGDVTGASFYGATLVCRDKIALRYYLKGDISKCNFYANGINQEVHPRDGLYYVEIADICPDKLDQIVELEVSDSSGNILTVRYSPMHYIARMSNKGSEATQNLVKALYNYHLAAKEVASL